MASNYKMGPAANNLTSIDGLTVALPDPQPEFRKYQEMERLGNLTMRGAGPQIVIWKFPLLDVEQVGQLETTLASTTHIQSKNRFDALHIYEVIPNVPSPKQDGDHLDGFRGLRGGFEVEFIILSEVS